MKKKLLRLVAASLLALTLGACGAQGGGEGGGGQGGGGEVVTYYTVAFNVNGERYATARVKEGEKITQTIADPIPATGFRFVGWFEGNTQIDLATYVVTRNVTFEAHFEEIHDDTDLSVDDKKVAGETYYLVFGWWETTGTNDDGTPKHTSYLTPTDVRVIYKNVRNYLTITGTTEAQLGQIQFRDYSSVDVATMGGLINADDDVDILFGVGNNINSTAGVALYNSSNDYKFQSPMGSTKTARYVAATSKATAKGIELYDWLKGTDAGKKALTDELTEQEIRDSLAPVTIDLTVTVHGDSDTVTRLQAADATINLGTITVPTGFHFAGFATSQTGEVVLNKGLTDTITYNDVKDLVAAGATTLDLYPIFEQDVVSQSDLVVYVQTQGNYLKDYEVKLLQARFNETLTTENVAFNILDGNADYFKEHLGADADVLIGGNNPLNTYTAHEQGALANAGAKHFANTSRKVLIKDTCNADHLTLAKKLYDFVVADAIEFEVHAAFWPKADHSWVTAAEVTAVTAGLEANLKTFLGLGESDTLADKYNVKLTTVEISTDTASGKDKVADLGAETRALRNGKGTDIIIGCGNNVDSESGAGMTIVEKKDIPASMVAAGRKVALVTENALTRNIFDVLFAEPQA